MERTFSIIKPDAVADGNIGNILQMITDSGLRIVATKLIHLSKEQAETFYAVHKERPFFNDLVEYMISGPVLVSALEGDNAITCYRDLMGATNPVEAAEGTIRKKYGRSLDANACHGSDATETACVEIPLFFTDAELVGK